MEQASETGLDEHRLVHATRLYIESRRQLHHKEPVHRQQRTDDLQAPAPIPVSAPPGQKSSNRHSHQEAAGPVRQATAEADRLQATAEAVRLQAALATAEAVHLQAVRATAEAARLQAAQATAEALAEVTEDKYSLKP